MNADGDPIGCDTLAMTYRIVRRGQVDRGGGRSR